MTTPSNTDRIYACIGRITGLAGTARYDLDDVLREELWEIVHQLESATNKLEASKEVVITSD